MADSPGWGKLNDGQRYQVLATDVFRALSYAGLGRYEQVLIGYLMERCWAAPNLAKRRGDRWPDPRPCADGVSDIARAILGDDAGDLGLFNTVRPKLAKAKSRLLRMGIIRETPGGLEVVKDGASWTEDDGRSPLLPGWLIRYAMASQPPGGNRVAEPSAPPAGCAEVGTTPVPESAQNLCPDRHNTCAEVGTTPVPESAQPHLIGARASEDSEDQLDSQKRVRADEAGRSRDAEPGPNQPAEFIDLCRAAAQIPALKATGFPRRLHDSWNGPDGGRVEAWWEAVPPAVWRDALNEMAGQPAARQTIGFYLGIVRNPTTRARHARASAGSAPPEPVKYHTARFPRLATARPGGTP